MKVEKERESTKEKSKKERKKKTNNNWYHIYIYICSIPKVFEAPNNYELHKQPHKGAG